MWPFKKTEPDEEPETSVANYRINPEIHEGVKWYRLHNDYWSPYLGRIPLTVDYYSTKEEAEAERDRRLEPHICEVSGHEC